MVDISLIKVAINHCRKVLKLIKQACSDIMIFPNSFDFKATIYVLLKLYLLFFPLFLLLFYYLSFSFILELLNGLEMFFAIDMAIQKVDESGFKNR